MSRPQQRNPRLPVPAGDVVAAYTARGLSVIECARRFGISRLTVRRVLDDAGVTRDPRRRARIRIDEQALVGVSRPTVSRILRNGAGRRPG